MGRHDLILSAALKGCSGLATGIYASIPVLTPTGWVEMAELSPGDLVVTRDHGALPIVTIGPERRLALWGVLFPKGALGNDQAVILPPGQLVLVQTAHASRLTGKAQALVPAALLEGWRGIAAHGPASTKTILQMLLTRPGLVQAGPGLVLGVDGVDTAEVDLIRMFLTAPKHVVLPLAAARHLVAALIAEEAGKGLRSSNQAALRPENRV
ncbi:MAG: Hint domain-containing protein [Cypionkella sp.]